MSREAIKQARAWINTHRSRSTPGIAPYLAPLSLAGTQPETVGDLLDFEAACNRAGVLIEVAESRDYVQIAETADLRRYRIYEVVGDVLEQDNWIPLCEVTAHGEVAAAVEAMQNNKVLSADVLDECNISIHVQDLGRCEQ